jgi:squalene cyclase
MNFRKLVPHHRADELDQVIARGIWFIESKQRADGSWVGSWAVCFTYASWFALDALHLAGVMATAPVVRKACEFLLSKQNGDGGWGESYKVRLHMFRVLGSTVFLQFRVPVHSVHVCAKK